MDRPLFFATPAELRTWFETHAEHERVLLVGYYRRATGRPSITWAESVDQALCFGWIDGVRRGIDAESYCIRFTPRKTTSTWSAVNIARVRALTEQGLMRPAGLAAFEARADERSAIYSYEQRHHAALSAEQERMFRADPAAWDFFSRQPPSYRKQMLHWVTSAKREQTRASRLARLIAASAAGQRVLF